MTGSGPAGRPLRIGVDARELSGRPTGTGRYLRTLVRAFTREHGDTVVAYASGEAPDDAALDHPRVLVRVLPALRPGVLWQQLRLPAAARVDALDVFFAPAYTCPWRLGVPCVTAVHDLSFFALPRDFAWSDGVRRRLTVARSIATSARVLACSDFTRREILARFPAARVAHVPLGGDDDLAAPPGRDEARRRLGVRGPLVLTVGAVFGRRRLPVLLRATAALPAAVLDVVGEMRAHPPIDAAGIARRLGVAHRVRLSGFVDEAGLADRYAAADVAVFLSEYEGFGLPALEAMARGVPVVVSARPSLDEIFGEAALVVEPEDEAAVAWAVRRVIDDPSLRADLVARGRALAARYSWRTTAARTREVLREVAEGRRG